MWDWIIAKTFYKVLAAYADQQPKLKGERRQSSYETMRDYRRAGLDLPKAKRDEVERMRHRICPASRI